MSLCKPGFVRSRILLLVVSALIVGGCSSSVTKIVDPKNKKIAFVYGYINMNEAKARLSWVALRRYRPSAQRYGSDIIDGTFFQSDGIFFHIGVDLGTYQVERFGSNANSGYFYTFGASGKNVTARNINKPGLHYMGAYKYISEKDRWGRAKKFSMKQTKQPTEKELLTALLKHVKYHYSEYPQQINWIEQRLAQL